MRRDLDRTGNKGQKAKNPRDSGDKGSAKERAKKRRKLELMEDNCGEAPAIKEEERSNRKHQSPISLPILSPESQTHGPTPQISKPPPRYPDDCSHTQESNE